MESGQKSPSSFWFKFRWRFLYPAMVATPVGYLIGKYLG